MNVPLGNKTSDWKKNEWSLERDQKTVAACMRWVLSGQIGANKKK